MDGEYESTFLRTMLWVWLVDAGAFGILILLVPGFLVETLAGDPSFNYYWLRWAGGILLGITLGTWYVIREPAGRGVLALASGVAAILAGVGLVWSTLAGEYGGAAWFLWLTYVSSLGVGALLLYARARARQVPAHKP